METLLEPTTHVQSWEQLTEQLGKEFAQRSAQYDNTDSFVTENYEALKSNGFFSAMIPQELGGGGISHGEMCHLLRKLAHYDGATALALSMHQHLIAANIWRYKRGNGGDEILKKVAANNLVLISTGAKDWLESNGEMEKVEGGYLVTAQKDFASQSLVGNILVTSAPYLDPAEGWQVLHFGVPMNSPGVSKLDNWYTLGMRGTGSHSVRLEKVFVPDAAIVLRRPKGKFHPFWNVVLTVALPLIMSVYVGIAERAATVALQAAKNKDAQNSPLPFIIGEMNNELITAQVLLKDMIAITNNMTFEPVDENGNGILSRKTVLAKATVTTVEKAMEAVGGKSFYRNFELERLFRDIQGSAFHPLPEKLQHQFTGEFLLKREAILE